MPRLTHPGQTAGTDTICRVPCPAPRCTPFYARWLTHAASARPFAAQPAVSPAACPGPCPKHTGRTLPAGCTRPRSHRPPGTSRPIAFPASVTRPKPLRPARPSLRFARRGFCPPRAMLPSAPVPCTYTIVVAHPPRPCQGEFSRKGKNRRGVSAAAFFHSAVFHHEPIGFFRVRPAKTAILFPPAAGCVATSSSRPKAIPPQSRRRQPPYRQRPESRSTTGRRQHLPAEK